jgi:AbrB family looped-hinge helix DNA binding protein
MGPDDDMERRSSCKTVDLSILLLSYEEAPMETVTISPKYQVVIPKSIRERLRLVPGQKVQAIVIGDHIEFVPVRHPSDLRGILRGLDTSVEREEDDRL